ncbi:MAG: DNA primase [Oscillospiraceae bacterium]|nr:DNA primase [Oscillospiraceae bacterium]
MKENRLPPDLAALPQWVCWRLEPDQKSNRDAKVPYCPATGKRASPSNPATWATLADALNCAEKYHYSGIGFMFTAESGVVGIDIDHCLTDGKPNSIAADILTHLPPTYIEISPSGTGLHIFLKGTLPPGGNRNSKNGVEMYAASRYFTMTGNKYQGVVDNIAVDDGALEYIHSKYVAQSRKTKAKSTNYQPGLFLSDNDVVLLAQQSKDGAAFDALWRGDWQEKYKSQSEADFALCRKLAFWTARNEAQIDRLFRQSQLYREKWDANHGNSTYGQTTVIKACDATDKVYTPPPIKAPPEIFQQGGCYYRQRGDKCYRITNFIVKPIEMILADDEAQLSCELLSEIGETHKMTFLTSDFATTAKLEGVLCKNTIAVSFLGGDSDLKLFKIYLYSLNWKRQRGVRATGIYSRKKKLVFVNSRGAIGAGGKAVPDIIQMSRYKNIESSILDAPFVDTEGLRVLGEHLLTYNEPAKTVSILAWCAGCFIKPHLRRIGIKFPHLFLIGETGSGKSYTLERVILPTLSLKDVTAAGQVTGFTLMRDGNSSNIFPQTFDEFKPSKINSKTLNYLYNHFRDSYDGHVGVRGNADQTITTYDLLAPIVVAGEESADESAIRERSIELLFSKKDLKAPGCRENHVWVKHHEALIRAFGRSLLDVALDTSLTEVAQWFDEGRDFFASDLLGRVHDNLCCMYCGLCLALKLCGRLGLAWDQVFPYDREACIKNLDYGVREYLLDGGSNSKSVVEQTFEVMARMNLKPGIDYAFENGHDFLCVWLTGVYDRYTRYRRDCAVTGEVLTYAQFRKQLEHSDFFVQKNKAKRMGDEIKKVWVLDFVAMQRQCDVAGFVKEQAEPEPAEAAAVTK